MVVQKGNIKNLQIHDFFFFFLRLTISGSHELGSYTCILKAEKEVSATFHLHGNLIDLYLFKIFVPADYCKAVLILFLDSMEIVM